MIPPGRDGCSFVVRGGEEDPVADAPADAVVDRFSLRGRGQCRTDDGARAALGDAQPTAPVTPQLLSRHHVILCKFETYEVRCKVEHEGGIDLVAVHRLP